MLALSLSLSCHGKLDSSDAVLVNAEPRHPPLILASRHDVKGGRISRTVELQNDVIDGNDF